MPSKIGFTVIFCSGEDERYRAADLNYHGPTVKGWRSSQHCGYPQDITLQLHSPSIINKIQILVHQYLIPHKIEIWICEDLDYDPSISPCGLQSFQYIGFITLSDNQATGFKSRELKSVTTPPAPARFLKLRLFENHHNDRNIYNQVGVVAISVLGDCIPLHNMYGDQLNNNDSITNSDANLICNPQYTSPYDDLAFEMYVDKDVARIMRLMERRKHQAVVEERFEYARKLKIALDELRGVGETLGRYDQEKRQAINMEDYDKAKAKKNQIDQYRDEVYARLCVEQLLELDGNCIDNDRSGINKEIRQNEGKGDEDDKASCDSRAELDEDTLSVQHSNYSSARPGSQNSYHVTWSPRHPSEQSRNHRQPRRTSLTDYPTNRTNLTTYPLSHSYSHTIFPTSSSAHKLEHQDGPHFDCYEPYLPSNMCAQPASIEEMYQSLPPTLLQEPLYLPDAETRGSKVNGEMGSTQEVSTNSTHTATELLSPPLENEENRSRANSIRAPSRQRSKSTNPVSQNSYEAYEERMLPALRHPQMPLNDVVRECHLSGDQGKKSKLNEREKKQAALPIAVFGIELVEKFYSKHFADKEEGLRQLQDELKKITSESASKTKPTFLHSPNKMARAYISLVHRALRDKVYSVYSAAADATRFFFHEFVPGRVSQTEVARSVEKLLPELIAKSGDVTPRIHNMAAHTLLSMVDCKQVRDLHIIPACLSRPLSSSVHPRLALSRLEMVEQLILNHGISTEKQSGLTCRTLAEFGSSGLHHPAEAVRKVSERVLLQVYRVNPRIVRKQLPPDDDVTRRNLLYRQLFQEFDLIDLQKRREQQIQDNKNSNTCVKATSLPIATRDLWNAALKESDVVTSNMETKNCCNNSVTVTSLTQIPKRTVNQMTSPILPLQPFSINDKDANKNSLKILTATKHINNNNNANIKASNQSVQHETLLRRRNMARISEEDGGELVNEPASHFTNLIDSVHLAETRRAFQQTISQNKTIEYIFPTTYIGNDRNKEILSKSKIPDMKNTDKFSSKSKPKISGIPVPKNGFKGRSQLTSIIKTGIPVLDSKATVLKSGATGMSITIPNENTSLVTLIRKQEQGDNSSTASGVTPPSDADSVVADKCLKSSRNNKTCIFCLEKDDWFSEESLNKHYWMACPMLTQCYKCNEVVEISGLIQHRLDDCEFKKSFIKCDRCQEAILNNEWDTHFCRSSNSSRTRCPFCHEDLASDGEWRNHLMGSKVCSHHPRKTANA